MSALVKIYTVILRNAQICYMVVQMWFAYSSVTYFRTVISRSCWTYCSDWIGGSARLISEYISDVDDWSVLIVCHYDVAGKLGSWLLSSYETRLLFLHVSYIMTCFFLQIISRVIVSVASCLFCVRFAILLLSTLVELMCG